MSKTYEDAILTEIRRQESEHQRANRASAAVDWMPEASFERAIRTRAADPVAYQQFLDSGKAGGFGGELAMYEFGREAAIDAGRFDPAKYQEAT